jgi:ribosomal protein L44E
VIALLLLPRAKKLLLVSGISLLVAALSLYGGSSVPAGEVEEPYDSQGEALITSHTQVLIYSWCPVCGGHQVLEGERYNSLSLSWLGLGREGLEDLLFRNFHSPTIQEFSRNTVVIDVIERCTQCENSWPPQGIISIHNSRLAIFTLEGALVEVLNEDVPADWYQELMKGIPYFSPEEGQQWIENLIS